MSDDRWGLGVDIGGTKIIIAHVAEGGNVLNQKIIPTNAQQGPLGVINHVIQEAHAIQSAARNNPMSIGIGMAGQILPEGIVEFAPNLGWHHVDLKGLISEALKIPVLILNDVRAATWGEWKFGAGKGFNDIVCLMIGTGIGGGAVIGGNLMTGANNAAGELGHFPVQLNGPKCTCGNLGCLESLAAGWAIAKQAKEAILHDSNRRGVFPGSENNDIDSITAKDVLLLAGKGDQTAMLIINNAIEAIVAGCIGYANVFNPSRLIIGGGLGLALPHLIERIEKGLKERALEAASEKLKVVPANLMQNAVAIGAADFALSSRATAFS